MTTLPSGEGAVVPGAIVGDATLYHADCRDVLRGLPDNSIDAVVTDPPYALVSIQKRFGKPGSAAAKHGKDGLYARASAGFMGKQWDTGEVAFSEEFWAEVLRVLKPGGHVVAFSGTRTYHRMAVAIEDAGFEIRDQLGWVYGSGFPKSHNQKGDWEGWGTALKPAWEPICLARKPLDGTVAANLAKWGTGALNIDGCRVEGESTVRVQGEAEIGFHGGNHAPGLVTGSTQGRWPANVCHDGSPEVLAAFPDTGPAKAGGRSTGRNFGQEHDDVFTKDRERTGHNDNGGSAARFFYCAKASRKDREEGLEGFEATHRPNGNKWTDQDYRVTRGERPPSAESGPRKNTHPTVKPTDLMRWLCRLVTPPGGVILDPFMGSGSTGKAALLEGFRFIGCEREDEYMPIAEARIAAAGRPVTAKQPAAVNDNQTDLFGRAA